MAEPPAAVLAALDRALRHLRVRTLATAVLAEIGHTPADADSGLWRLRWSNAGQLPPLLIDPDGTVPLLRTQADLLLGVDLRTRRADPEHVLQPGTTVLLYTGGLIERRGATIDDGLNRLVALAGQLSGLTLDDLCDRLLTGIGATATTTPPCSPSAPTPGPDPAHPRPCPRSPRMHLAASDDVPPMPALSARRTRTSRDLSGAAPPAAVDGQAPYGPLGPSSPEA